MRPGMSREDSTLLHKGPCDECGSSDANAHYDDGHTYCFSCQHYGRHDGEAAPRRSNRMSSEFLTGEIQALLARGITEETCRKYGYRVGKRRDGTTVQIADHR